jgi:hypothetical protein
VESNARRVQILLSLGSSEQAAHHPDRSGGVAMMTAKSKASRARADRKALRSQLQKWDVRDLKKLLAALEAKSKAGKQ